MQHTSRHFTNVRRHDLRPRLSRRYFPLLYTCVRPFGPFLLRCILAQTQTQIPDVIPCYFIDKSSGFVIHQINPSLVLRQRHSEGVSYQHQTRHETIWFLIGQSFLTCWCDGCCQMMECAKFERSSSVYETSCNI